MTLELYKTKSKNEEMEQKLRILAKKLTSALMVEKQLEKWVMNEEEEKIKVILVISVLGNVGFGNLTRKTEFLGVWHISNSKYLEVSIKTHVLGILSVVKRDLGKHQTNYFKAKVIYNLFSDTNFHLPPVTFVWGWRQIWFS